MDRYETIRSDYEVMLQRSVQNAGCDLQKDMILPDTYGDMKKILATTVKLSPHADSIESDGVSYSGVLSVTVMFLTEDGEVASLPVECDYEGRVPMPFGEGTVRVASFPSVENPQSRLVNPRKIGIRARIRPNLYVWEDFDTALGYPDSVSDEDRLTFEERLRRIRYFSAESYRAEGVESGDDILLDPPREAIKQFLMGDIRFSALSTEARSGAVAVNANADITLWYTAEDDGEESLCTLKHTLPISTLVECEAVREGQTVIGEIYCEDISFSPRENTDGEKRTVECDFTYAVSLLVCRESEAFVCEDAYSTRYETTLAASELSLTETMQKTAASARASLTISGKEGFLPIGSQAVLKNCRMESGEAGKALLCGNAQVYVILERCDKAGFGGETVELPFTVSLGVPYESESEYLVLPSLNSVDVKASGGELSVSLALSCSVASFRTKREAYVNEILPTALCEQRESGAFTVYYPREMESAWEIAKKYRVREDDLIFAGSEEFRAGISRRCVMIPPQKDAAYRKVIAP